MFCFEGAREYPIALFRLVAQTCQVDILLAPLPPHLPFLISTVLVCPRFRLDQLPVAIFATTAPGLACLTSAWTLLAGLKPMVETRAQRRRANSLDVLDDNILTEILQLVCERGEYFSRQHAQPLCTLELVCSRFARLLRQPLPVYRTLEVHAVGLQEPHSSDEAAAAARTRDTSLSSWLQAGRCAAVTSLRLQVDYAASAGDVLQRVAAGLHCLHIGLRLSSEADANLEAAASTCTGLTKLHLKNQAVLPDELPPIGGLMALSALCQLQHLSIDGFYLAEGPQPAGHLASLTSLDLTLHAQCELRGLDLLTNLHSLHIWRIIAPAQHPFPFPLPPQLSRLEVASHLSLQSLDLRPLKQLNQLELMVLPQLSDLSCGQKLRSLSIESTSGFDDRGFPPALLSCLQQASWKGSFVASLDFLRIAGSSVDSVSSYATRLLNLRSLILETCSLQEWPDVIEGLPTLENLLITENHSNLELHPDHFAALTRLTFMRLTFSGPHFGTLHDSWRPLQLVRETPFQSASFREAFLKAVRRKWDRSTQNWSASRRLQPKP